jgi:hypothetical protein
MIAKHAKDVARRWVFEEGSRAPGFCGAFFHGSINWLVDGAVLPETSDLDVMIVLAGPDTPNKPGKLKYHDVILEVSYLPWDELQSPEHVLGQPHLAGSFRGSSVISDPSGRLTQLQEVVSREYARRKWVYKRCEHAREKVLNNLRGIDALAPFHDQVAPWLFATGVTTHVLLVAGLKNPTVRRRYAAVRELLEEYGRLDFYDTLLEMLGCARMTRAQAEGHLAALAEAFDAAGSVIKTPFFFAADISDLARPVAIDGSRELIERGHHREAIFWMVATYSRCLKVLYHDAPEEMQAKFEPGYRRLMADLGITSFPDLRRCGDQVRAMLPRVWEVAEAIIAANPDVRD